MATTGTGLDLLSNRNNQTDQLHHTVQELLGQVLDTSISENNKINTLNEQLIFLQTSLNSAKYTIEYYEKEFSNDKINDLNEKLLFIETALKSATETIEDYEDEFRGFEGLLFEKRRLWDQAETLTNKVLIMLI